MDIFKYKKLRRGSPLTYLQPLSAFCYCVSSRTFPLPHTLYSSVWSILNPRHLIQRGFKQNPQAESGVLQTQEPTLGEEVSWFFQREFLA